MDQEKFYVNLYYRKLNGCNQFILVNFDDENGMWSYSFEDKL